MIVKWPERLDRRLRPRLDDTAFLAGLLFMGPRANNVEPTQQRSDINQASSPDLCGFYTSASDFLVHASATKAGRGACIIDGARDTLMELELFSHAGSSPSVRRRTPECR